MKTKSTFTVIFYTRKSRNQSKELSIYARITVNGKRAEMSLKRSIAYHQWDNIKNRGRGNSEQIKSLNAYLDQVYSKLLQCHNALMGEDKILSADAVKSRYLGEDDISKTLKDLISYHNETMIHVLKKGTMKNYYTTERYLDKFLQKKRKVKDIYLKQLNFRFITEFEQYLRTYKNSKKKLMLSNNGVMKHLERFKKMINLALKLEWIQKNPFSQFQLKFIKYDRQFLNERELALFENKHFKSERLQKIQDCFVFSCYTGLSYIDVKDLTESNIVKGIDNNNWIYTKREKTDEQVKIPILPKAWAILEKYRNLRETDITKHLLPISSNQKTNAYLKEITKACGIHKNTSFHVARHTFATTVMLTNGVPIETVSKLLGHAKLSTTQIYARVIETKISEDISNLLERFKKKAKNKSA